MSYKRGSINEVVGEFLGGIAKRVITYPAHIVGGLARGAIEGGKILKGNIKKGKEYTSSKDKAPVKKGKLPKKSTSTKEPETTE